MPENKISTTIKKNYFLKIAVTTNALFTIFGRKVCASSHSDHRVITVPQADRMRRIGFQSCDLQMIYESFPNTY